MVDLRVLPMIAIGVVPGFSLGSEDRRPETRGVPGLGWRISHGGIEFESAHNPRLACRASSSRRPKLTSFEYCRYHQARPARSSSRLTFVPSGNTTSATVRPWRSLLSTWIMTSLPRMSADVNCWRFCRRLDLSQDSRYRSIGCVQLGHCGVHQGCRRQGRRRRGRRSLRSRQRDKVGGHNM